MKPVQTQLSTTKAAPADSPFRKGLRILFGGASLLLVILAALILQTNPSVTPPLSLTPVETRQLEQLIVDNSPSQFSETGDRYLTFNAEELNLLATFGSRNISQLEGMAAAISLNDSAATLDLSAPWPSPYLPFFLNLQLEIAQEGEQLQLRKLYAGNLRLPRFTVDVLARQFQRELDSLAVDYQELADLQQSIQQLEIAGDMVHMQLQWEPQLLKTLRAQAQQLFISTEDRNRILHYYALIREISEQHPEVRTTSLHTFIAPLFREAKALTAQGSDPIAENRTLLQTLSLYVNYMPIEQLVGAMPDAWNERARRMTVSLQRRNDLSQHFVLSAAIAASAGVGVAEVLSNSKEVYDARFRSGFSFSDMTANLAGMALGNAASVNAESARNMQDRMAAASSESDYMPDAGRDNTGLSEEDFANAYNDRNDPRYLARITALEQQIAALRIYTSAVSEGVQ